MEKLEMLSRQITERVIHHWQDGHLIKPGCLCSRKMQRFKMCF